MSILRANRIPPGIVPTQISITLSMGQCVAVPIFPPGNSEPQADREFRPSAAQIKIMRACRDAPKSATQLKLVESNLYRSPGGIGELQAHGLMDRTETGKYQLTEFGKEWFESQEDEEEDETRE